MSNDEMLDPIVQSAIRDAQKALGTYEEFGVLGDEVGRINGGLPQNRVWVRKIISDGQYSKAYIAIAHTHKTGAYMVYAGSPVVLGYVNRELAIMGQNHKTTESLGYNPAVLNTGDASLQGVATTDILPLLCHAVGTSATPSTKVGIKSFRYFTVENTIGWYNGGVSTQVDLASSIPTAGDHCYACIFFNTGNQTFTVVASTPKVLAIPLADSDKQICFNGMPPYSIPVAMWRLQNAQTAVTQADFVEDLRPLYGQGTARQNLSATTNPAVTDDSGDGYGVGSVWINLTLDTIYICTDASVGSANWELLSTGAGFTSWTMAGQTGSEAVTDGQTATWSGDGYVETVESGTRTIVISYVATPLHLMGW